MELEGIGVGTFFTCCVQVEAFCEVIHGHLWSTSRRLEWYLLCNERWKTGSPNDRGIWFFIRNFQLGRNRSGVVNVKAETLLASSQGWGEGGWTNENDAAQIWGHELRLISPLQRRSKFCLTTNRIQESWDFDVCRPTLWLLFPKIPLSRSKH